jgi:NADP-dependent 3-hydroxy acid dehydrogenase YdfG
MTETPVALITGGSTGIGAATARQLLTLGYRVAVTARRAARLDAFAAEVGRPTELLTLPGDAADDRAVRDAVEATVDAFGRLDVAVANAGYASFDSITDGDPGTWRDMVLTNVLGPILLVREALPALRASRGRIVLVSSVVGRIYSKGNVYGATKWALSGLAENTRLAVTDDGIGVTLVEPGVVDSAFWEPVGGVPAERKDSQLTVDELAATIVWAVTQPPGVDINTLTVRSIGSPT